MSVECRRCGHVSSCKSNLMKHLRRKVPCLPMKEDISIEDMVSNLTAKEYNDVTYDCSHCGKRFNTRQSKSRHMQICKAKKDIDTDKSQINKLIQEVEELKRRIGEVSNNNVVNINNGTVNNNNIKIEIKNFGNENMAALPMRTIRECFSTMDFKNMFEALYCDDDFPENQNVKLKSKKDKQLLLYKSDKWNITSFDNGLEEIFNKLYNIFDEFARQHEEEAIEDSGEEEYYKMRRLLQAACEKLDKAGKVLRKEVDKDIICALEEKKLVV